MNTRVLLFAGLLATAAIAFSGTMAEHTGVELTRSAEAVCTEIPDPQDPLGRTVCAQKYYCPVLESLGGACPR